MLSVYLKDGSVISLVDGQTAPHIMWGDIVFVAASGAELNLIISYGYPDHRFPLQRYLGDTAKQIVANWGVDIHFDR